MAAWKDLGFDAQAFDAAKFVKLPAPGVEYRMDVAAATSLPWVDANGWRFARDGSHAYYYDRALAQSHAGGSRGVCVWRGGGSASRPS